MKKQQCLQSHSLSSPHSQLAIDIELHEYILLAQSLLIDLIQEQSNASCTSIFNSHEAPSISIQAYLRRVHKFTKYSKQCLILSIIYLDRYNMSQSQFRLSKNNVHRILITCLMLAVKFNDDIYFDNVTFEKAGGVSIKQLGLYEMELFEKLEYNCYVQQEEYEALVQKLYSVYGAGQQQ